MDKFQATVVAVRAVRRRGNHRDHRAAGRGRPGGDRALLEAVERLQRDAPIGLRVVGDVDAGDVGLALTPVEAVHVVLDRLVHVDRVLVDEDLGAEQVDLAEQMIRAIARQAEAERERRAKIVNAEGEFQAAEKMVQAAAMISKEPIALQLRFLQTMREISSEHNTTTFLPVPIDLFAPFAKKPTS